MKKTLLILLLALSFSCSSDDSDQPTDTNPPDSNLLAYINGEVDGVAFTSSISEDISQNTVYGVSNSYQPQSDSNGQCYNINYEPTLYPTLDETQPYMGVGFIDFLQNAGFSCSEELDNFGLFFFTGNYDYATDAFNFGVKVNYGTSGDSNQVYYNSYGGPQDNSTFVISSVQVVDCGFSKCATIIGTFSCRVYNEQDTTDFKDITNGEYKLIVQSFNP